MSFIPERLVELAAQIKIDNQPREETVRNLLSWFGAQRRGYWVVQSVRTALEGLGLTTEPNFEHAYIDASIKIISAPGDASAPKGDVAAVKTDEPIQATVVTPTVSVQVIGGAVPDPVPRIGMLASANHPPVAISRDKLVSEAATIMMFHDYSQLPVMANERRVDGSISWRSIGAQRALGRSCEFVRDCMEPVRIVDAEAPLFNEIDAIIQNGFVLVQNKEKKITGIVTASDIGEQFRAMSEPFLLLGEIENHLRRIIADKYSLDALKAVRDPADQGRVITKISDLTFGEYIRLLENAENWKLLGLPIDRKVFIDNLSEIRRIRNDVMHFDPDAAVSEDIRKLRDVVRFMQRL